MDTTIGERERERKKLKMGDNVLEIYLFFFSAEKTRDVLNV